MKNKEKISEILKKESERLEIPEELIPEKMREKLMESTETEKYEKIVENHPKKAFELWKMIPLAASICIIVGAVWLTEQYGMQKNNILKEETAQEEKIEIEEEIVKIAENTVTYEQIYNSMEKAWETEYDKYSGYRMPMETAEGILISEDAVMEMDVSAGEDFSNNYSESEKKEFFAQNSQETAYGTTNVQTAGVDEGDIVKNDGRYLYQVIQKEKDYEIYPAIQIIDTKDGLKELSVIEGLSSVEEIYVWKDVLVVIERKYTENSDAIPLKERAVKDMLYIDNSYHQITFYDLKDRTKPEVIKTFTLQGSYASSRITDGYFYGFSRFYANPGNGAEDLDSYIPSPGGARLLEDNIVLPEESKGTSYLVLVSVDLNNPTEFVQTAGIVTNSELYYVSEDSIYVTDYRGSEQVEGTSTDKTAVMRFSYWDGKFRMEAEGEVPGRFNDTFSLNEDNGYLRVVSTVWEYEKEMMVDDRTGEEFGFNIRESSQSNALYVFDRNLKMVGKIEGLAENEQIYSARFLGDTGYFVTFRQVDPLFAVDLSDPQNPEILDELKVSGFSEYLHFYSKDRLLGIGMEADEETGRTEGMKLSMFDISDPRELAEIAKEPLKEYHYSEALYNHRAVMISPAANLLGFAAEGNSSNGKYMRNYLVYSYVEDEFVERLKLEVENPQDNYDRMRGTFIGDAFYLLCSNGKVEKYDLNTGKLVEKLIP